MKIRKPLFIIFGIFLFTLMLGVGAGLYYYTHPPKVKALAEKAASRATGASVSIQHLSYSMNPIKIHAKGISFQPVGEENGFSAQIQDFVADCVLDGSFGRKTLVFRRLQVNGFECRVREGATAVSEDNRSEGPSFLNSMAGFFVSFFLFKDLRLAAAEIGEGRVVARWGGRRIEVSGLSGHLNADHLMDIRGGIVVESPNEHTTLSIPDFHIETTSALSLADPKIDLTLAFSDGDLRSPQAKVKNIRAKTSMHYDHRKQKIAFSDLNLSLKGVEGRFGELNIAGPMDFSGTFSGGVKQGRWVFDSHVQGNMKNSPVSYRAKKISVKGLMKAQVAVMGPVSNLKLSGTLTGNQVAFKGKGVSVKSAAGTLNFSGSYPHFEIRELSCRIPEIKHAAEKKISSVTHIEIDSTQGQVNLLKRSLNFPEIRLNASLLSNIRAAFQMDKGRLTITAKGKETGLFHTASRLKLLPSDWTFQGMDTLAVTATVDKKGAIAFSTHLALKKFGFQNPQGTCLGENISLRAQISGRITPPPLTIRATGELSADGGEVLMDRFYFDFGENAFFAQYNGSYQGSNKRLKLDKLSLGMDKIATAHVTGTLFQAGDEYEGELSLKIPGTPVKAPFHRLIREPFQTEKPAFSKVRLEGIVGAEMILKGKKSHWMTQGVCTWKDGALFYGDAIYALTGIQLSLPVWLTNGKGEGAAQNLEGGLSVRSMRLPFLPEQGLKVPIQAAPNRLFMPAATTLAVPGGTVRIGPSRITNLMTPSPAIHTALHFEDLQLEPVLSGIWPHAVTGSAGGNLDPIHIEGGRLQSTGEIKADIFDGALTLSHVGARGLFTALPVYHLNARWHHLNLAEMTEGTSFGKIEGILNGYAKKLEVSDGQLQRFDLLLDTVKTDDVPQKISVKAVDNIARLGGGQSPFAGMAGLFVSFFKEFPYEKIGVHATLENDVFRIHGTILKDGREYLVKRGFFSGVDVINQSKDNRVGFKDMLKRIKRITDSKGGPVVR